MTQPKTNEPTLENALYSALDCRTGDEEKWQALRESGAADEVLTAVIREVFGTGGGSTVYGGYECKGGKSPQFIWFDDGPRHKAQKLTGKRLLAKVREVMAIGAPGAIPMVSQGADPEALHKEMLRRYRGESEPAPESPKCECGETEAQHDGPGGVCGLADCYCCGFTPALEDDEMGFHPGFPPGLDPEMASKGLGQVATSTSNGHHPRMLQGIPLDQIVPWQAGQMRKYFDPVKLNELADSIREKGVRQPILLRPFTLNGDDSKQYEIIYGERRYRAAGIAGLEEIPAIVEDLDDKESVEIQAIENLQRSDLSPVEEAQGYKRLLDEHGYTAESLAAKLGKSKSYVYGRLKICNLPEPALNALAWGHLPATIGELIGRLPSMEMREEFWQEHYGAMGQQWFEAPSFRKVKEIIEREFMKELKNAPFGQADKKLPPGVPSCKDCPKRTGNNKVDYPDSRADVCTDTDCYDRKVEAFNRRKLAEAAAEPGVRVLTDEESEKYLGYGFLRGELARDYVDLADDCDEAGDPDDFETDPPTFAQLLGDAVKPEVVGMSKGGKIHQLVSREAAAAALAEKGIHLKDPVPSNPAALYKNEQKRQKELRQVRQQAAAEIVASALRDVDDTLFTFDKFLRIVAKFLIDKGDADVARAIAKRRQIEIKPADVRGSVEKIVDGLDERGVLGLIVEWLLTRELEYWALGMGGDKFPLCEYFGLKPKQTEKRIADDRKREAKEKEKTKKKAKAKPKLIIQA